jgi:hypothetical protein
MRVFKWTFLCLTLASGCASWFMNGGKLVDPGYAPAVKASYTAPACTMADGSSAAGPANIRFQLVQEGSGTGIFERSQDGSGAVITNQWADGDGDHYFGWVQSNGWEYVIPRDASKQPVRRVYTGLQTRTEGGATKPASPVSGTCPLVAAG